MFDHKAILLAALLNIQSDGPADYDLGICYNVAHAGVADADAPEVTNILNNLFVIWPKYTGEPSFPVPHPTMDPETAYMDIDDIWEDEYGDTRKELLAFLIAELQKDTNV